jgi:DNA-binding SARP family transcriptional activator/tetratricopeptide (TPR) repeat protein
MVRLRVLGPADLRDADGREISDVLRQRKRLAFLTFLAVAPRPFQRRDSLVALFWPELDIEHARAALRRTLYWLRSALGAEVIESRGDDEVGVSTQHLWCDAAEFAQRMARSDLHGALELYVGDLLEGLHPDVAPELERALDAERSRLRSLALEAARGLAERAFRDARWREAGHWATRALSIGRHDENALRTLMESLSRDGDRAGALRAYDAFARDLMHELGIRPSREVRELHERIRTSSGEWTPARSARPDIEASVSPSATTGAMAIFPFTVHGGPEYGYLGEGFVDLLAAALDGAGPLRVVEPTLVTRGLRERGVPAAPDVGQATEIAAHLGADAVVLGSIVEAGGQLRASCVLYRNAHVVTRVETSGSAEGDVFQMVDDLARALLTERDTGAAARLTRLAATTTSSIVALKAYLRGEAEFRASHFLAAIDWFRRATDADPLFALAHHRLAAAASAAGVEPIAQDAVRQASALRERLPERDRALVDAQRAWLEGDSEAAERATAAALEAHPDDAEAWFLLGEIQFHEGPMRGRRSAEASDAMRRAVELDPSHTGALLHLARIAALDGRMDEVQSLLTGIATAAPNGDRGIAALALGAFAAGDAMHRQRALSQLARARSAVVAMAFTDVALFARDLDGADALASLFTSEDRSRDVRAVGHLARAHLALARGRLTDALSQLQQAQPLAPAWAREVRAMFALAPWLPESAARPREVLETLEAWDPTNEELSRGVLLWVHNAIHVPARHWLCGHLATRVGDPARAIEHAEALERLDANGQFPQLAMPYARGVRAAIARARGESAEALRLLDGARPRVPPHLALLSPLLSATPERLMRAALLRELGRYNEAAGWYGAIAERSVYDLIHLAATHLARSEIHREHGDQDRALKHDAAIVRLWRDCDDELRPVVDEARRRLRRAGKLQQT